MCKSVCLLSGTIRIGLLIKDAYEFAVHANSMYIMYGAAACDEELRKTGMLPFC